ncbi:hypothetical protein K440DRAFT_620738 [Wilcoxina mikolae CBS 423.85]|nr:hypothetical protein K440DRAFT_620738 [Wilcoxina mikolae CBS 423.85]
MHEYHHTHLKSVLRKARYGMGLFGLLDVAAETNNPPAAATQAPADKVPQPVDHAPEPTDDLRRHGAPSNPPAAGAGRCRQGRDQPREFPHRPEILLLLRPCLNYPLHPFQLLQPRRDPLTKSLSTLSPLVTRDGVIVSRTTTIPLMPPGPSGVHERSPNKSIALMISVLFNYHQL